MRDVANALDVRAALREAMGRLQEAQVPSHALAAELLLMYMLGCERAWLYAHPEATLDPARLAHYFDLVARRAAGVPTQYLTGRQEFWGLEFEVTPDVLIPRPETEHVVEVALERLAKSRVGRAGRTLRVADVGTGSGCLVVTLARELPHAKLFAMDISPAALAVARRNAARHGVAGRIRFVAGSLLEAVSPSSSDSPRLFDLLVSNPPYIGWRQAKDLPREVREHEPDKALYGGECGFEIYGQLIAQAAKLLVPGGIVVLEMGYDASKAVPPLLRGPQWTHAGVTRDLAGIARVVAAELA